MIICSPQFTKHPSTPQTEHTLDTVFLFHSRPLKTKKKKPCNLKLNISTMSWMCSAAHFSNITVLFNVCRVSLGTTDWALGRIFLRMICIWSLSGKSKGQIHLQLERDSRLVNICRTEGNRITTQNNGAEWMLKLLRVSFWSRQQSAAAKANCLPKLSLPPRLLSRVLQCDTLKN